MLSRKKIRLGDLLVENKIISQAQLETALDDQKKSGRKLGRVLIDNGYLNEFSLLEFLAQQLKIPRIDLKHHSFDVKTVNLISELQARRFRAIALDNRAGEVLVGMADPTDIFAFDELSRIVKKPIKVAVVSETELLHTFESVYRRTEEISNLAEELHEELTSRDVDLGQLVETDEVSDAPVVKLLQSLFEDAIQVHASDIHIEPDEKVLRIRQRIDGVLQEQVMEERKRIASALVLRLKVMAGLDIAEKRLPQDGRFSVRVKDGAVDVRLSTMPVQHGESVVMRLLDQSAGILDLEQVGMPPAMQDRFEKIIRNPHGMVLVTGPTGSGKTTTLYGALNELNRPESKIITVEDPVEYSLPRINQVQVHPKIGLTFARVLRTVLRQDPDVVLVGEMRDEETVDIGLRAAMTGHLVLSTLHTNDTVSTVARLMDMGAKGYLVASALQAVLAQRLVRRICDSCITDYQPDPQQQAWLRQMLGPAAEGLQLKHGPGCSHCGQSGYRGRIGVYELLEMDSDLAGALADQNSGDFARRARLKMGRETLAHAAVGLARRGVTTLDEAIRVAGAVEENLEQPVSEPDVAVARA